MADLAALRLRFVNVIGRLDFLLNGDKSTNTDDGANDYLVRAVRELDVEAFYLSGGDKRRKFVKVLAIGDYNFTVPEFLELNGIRMLTGTTEVDMADGRLGIHQFRNLHNRPYSDWSNGVPFDWAVNDAILQEEVESAVPASAVGQEAARLVTSKVEMLNNASFADPVSNVASGVVAVFSDKFYDALYWQRGSGYPNANLPRYLAATEDFRISHSHTASDLLIQQDISDMLRSPRINKVYTVSITVTGFSLGEVIVYLGDAVGPQISANGTATENIVPTDLTTDPNLRVIALSTETTSLEIASLSLKMADVEDSADFSVTVPTEDVLTREGIVFYPPTDVERTVEVYGKFFTPTMVNDTDVNFWSLRLPDLIIYKAAELYYTDLGNSARTKHFMDLVGQRINRLDNMDALEEDNEMAGHNAEPMRGVPDKWKA